MQLFWVLSIPSNAWEDAISSTRHCPRSPIQKLRSAYPVDTRSARERVCCAHSRRGGSWRRHQSLGNFVLSREVCFWFRKEQGLARKSLPAACAVMQGRSRGVDPPPPSTLSNCNSIFSGLHPPCPLEALVTPEHRDNSQPHENPDHQTCDGEAPRQLLHLPRLVVFSSFVQFVGAH